MPAVRYGAGVLVACALSACGGEPAGSRPAAEQVPLERRVGPDAPAIVEVDVVALRRELGLRGAVEGDERRRMLVASAVPVLQDPDSPLVEAVDEGKITHAVHDVVGHVSVVETDQPFAEIERALLERGARRDGNLVRGPVGDAYAAAATGDGALVIGPDAASVGRAVERTDGGIAAELQGVLGLLDEPVRAAAMPSTSGCVVALGIGAGAGDDAMAVIELTGRPSGGRVALRRSFWKRAFDLGEPIVEGSRITVPVGWSVAAPTEVVRGDLPVESIYRC